jgi:beta-lactam-binding protein with PASTA domain
VVGLDEDDAKLQAESAGYEVRSVYVCDSGVVKNGGAAPKSGLVLAVTSCTVPRGTKHAFLHVATSDPYRKARRVPSLSGLNATQARSKLAAVGLGLRTVNATSSGAGTGKYFFQAPAAGSYLPGGSSAILVLTD